ncbi:MAG: adenylyl-sulfate kinase [Vallitaleaceae bacterium]|nr:adenylyl-sulfate kinase [Vallitaleaceae bacterium]
MVYWITGRSSSGKTVYAKRLKRFLEEAGIKVLLLDGDEVRDQFTDNEYTDESRLQHIMKIAFFASIAERQGLVVIIALISPKKEWRMKARKLFEKSMLIYMPGGYLWEGTDYEEPDHEEMMCEG